MGMVDLTPAILGVEPDPIRLFMSDLLGYNYDQSQPRERPRRIPGARSHNDSSAWRPYHIISKSVDSIARIVIAITSALFLVAPMLALSYIDVKWARLLTASLFILFFCVVTSAAPQAKNHEVIMMTAAYAAVIVVFVGQTS
ncbi:hypothetical protein E8E14_007950 [Neopestalotiopsis sp. 37M]|nr:hypothetical protein E8E14_007950 [Neopestalotiopsis sp. 37M]